MKKVFWLILSCVLFIGCSDDKDEPVGVQIDQLVGEWVYDHPEEGVWETQKFLPSGVFYYWNKVSGGWKFQNTANGGRYWIEDGNRVTCQYSLNGVSMQVKMTMRSISEYSYTAEYNDGASLGVFTYARLLDKFEIEAGDDVTPDYNVLVKTTIADYKSHDTSVATVDASSGKITGVGKGHTYVDVVTSEGTAVVEVTVFDPDNMFDDYSYAFGKTVPEIVEILGDGYSFREDETGLIYPSDDYLTDEIRFITGIYDKTHIEYVLLSLNDKVSASKIIEHLSGRYVEISHSEGTYNYITDKTVDGNPVAIVYDSAKATLSFMVLRPSDRWIDFTYMFGFSDSDVNKEMAEWGYPYLFSDYSYSKNGSDYYTITDNHDASMVGFVFNGENKMCEYWVYLYEDYMDYASDIIKWLKDRYNHSEAESSPSQYVFYDTTKRLRVVFDASGYVSYTDNEQIPFIPASRTAGYGALDKKIDRTRTDTGVKKGIIIPKVPVLVRN